MRSFLLVIILVFMSHQSLFSQTFSGQSSTSTMLDSIVYNIIDDIDSNSVRSFIQELQDFGTRYFLAENRKEVAEWIAGKFSEFGFNEVEIDSFFLDGDFYGNSWHYNVIATLPGEINPDEIFLFGAHYDSKTYSDPVNYAPGADDNATGVAGILEIARVMILKEYRPASTIMFVSHSVEEEGLRGARDYSQKAKNAGMDIQLMIDIDMIGYSSFPLDSSVVNLATKRDDEEHYLTAIDCVNRYTELVSNYIYIIGDSRKYQSAGFETVGFFERENNPNYHSDTDLIDFINMPYCTEVVKSACATMLSAMYKPPWLDQLTITELTAGESVLLNWEENKKEDIAGYNIYIGTESREYNRIATLTETEYIVGSLENGTSYYFGISVIDSDGIESSIFEEKFTPFIFTLDQGILVVDETDNSDYTDQEDDNFYRDLLSNFTISEYDLLKKKNITAANMGIYSTVIWHNCDASSNGILQDISIDLRRYLDAGGNFIYTGNYPARAFMGGWDYPIDLTDGDIMYDYLKISKIDNQPGAWFNQALSGSTDYTNIHADSAKTLPQFQYHLSGVQGIYASSLSTEIFFFDSDYDPSSTSSEMLNEPIGVEYLGEDYKVITLSFPMGYMEKESAKHFFETVLAEKFNEPTDLSETQNVVLEYTLSQNYPNPFNPLTVINYSIPSAGNVVLNIYDVLGREIETLVNEHQKSGNYNVKFDAAYLSTGVYFYTLQVYPGNGGAGVCMDTKKMILLR